MAHFPKLKHGLDCCSKYLLILPLWTLCFYHANMAVNMSENVDWIAVTKRWLLLCFYHENMTGLTLS